MDDLEITNLMLLRQFRKCSHLQSHRMSRFQGQGRILILLRELEVITQRELSDIMQRRAATLSEKLEIMESNGLITRTKNSADKRNIDIRLTDKGREMALEAEQERAGTADTLFSILDTDEKVRLHEIMKKLHTHWQKEEINAQTSGEAKV